MVRRGPRSSKLRAPAHQSAVAFSSRFSSVSNLFDELEKVLLNGDSIVRNVNSGFYKMLPWGQSFQFNFDVTMCKIVWTWFKSYLTNKYQYVELSI